MFSWYGLGPLVLVQRKLKVVRHETILDNSVLPTLWSSLEKSHFCYNMIMLQYVKWCLYRTGLMTWEFKNWIGLPRAPILIPSRVFGMSWNADCKLDHNAKICSQPAKDSSRTVEVNSCGNIPNLVDSFPRRTVAMTAAKDRPTSY